MADANGFKLIIEDDEGRRSVVLVDVGDISIGRLEGNTIRLDERNVSRRHARVFRDGGNGGVVYAEDLDSYNGVWVNGSRVKGRQEVHDGDVLRIGDFQIELHGVGPESRGEEAAARDPDTETTEVDLRFAPAPEAGEPRSAEPIAESAPGRAAGSAERDVEPGRESERVDAESTRRDVETAASEPDDLVAGQDGRTAGAAGGGGHVSSSAFAAAQVLESPKLLAMAVGVLAVVAAVMMVLMRSPVEAPRHPERPPAGQADEPPTPDLEDPHVAPPPRGAGQAVDGADLGDGEDEGSEAADLPEPEPPRGSAEALYLQGARRLSAKELREAIGLFTRCIEVDSAFCLCYRANGIAYALAGNGPRAYSYYKQYLDVCPTAADAGEVRRKMRRYEAVR